jgi:glycosyltransferase involved in cell wall biosynthesis
MLLWKRGWGTSMRILYADTGLRGLEGHITSSALALPPAFRRLGHNVTVLGQRDLVPSLREATGAVPLFQYYTWGSWSSDPLIGWLADFTNIVDATLADLHRGWVEHGPFDFIYFNTGRAAQLAAAGFWLKEIFSAQGDAPVIAFQLGPDPGLVRSGSKEAPVFALRDPTTILHRYAAHLISKEWLQRLTLLAVNETVAEEYSFIVDSPVKSLTTPEELPVPRRRKPDGKLTIGFLGYQRIDKGYELLPDLIQQLLQIHANVRFLVQHSDPLALAQDYSQRNLAVTEKLRELADRDQRVELVLRPVVGTAWFDLIGCCDIVTLPYDPVRYASSYSAIFGEALSSGAPIVAPGGTTMSAEIDKAGGVGVSFSQWTVASIASAISLAVNDFDDFAERAYQGEWRGERSMDRMPMSLR